MPSSDDRAAVQAGVDVKVMLTLRLAEALGYDDPILDFDDLCERVWAFTAFHQRALGLREAVEAMWSQRRKVMDSDSHTGGVLDGGAAAMDDLFHHPDTPESLRLPKLIAERGGGRG